MSSDNEGGLLVLVLDAHCLLAAAAAPEEPPGSHANTRPDLLLSQVMVFVNAFLLLNERNELAVYCASSKSCDLLYSTQAVVDSPGQQHHTPGSTLHSRLVQALQQQQDPKDAGGAETGMVLSGALSRALCYIQRFKRERQAPRAKSKPRILVLQTSSDAAARYIAVMNAIFSAQRAEVVIDAMVFSANDSPLLQQATHLTGGVYERIQLGQEPLQYLLTLYAADTYTRSMLRVHKSVGVDFRASCFCHKRTIDIGCVCSICLSIFCRNVSECTTCGTSFSGGKRAKPSTSGAS